MSKKLLTTCIVIGLLVMPARAYAHVLLSDSTKTVGAILHVTPDDDPIAGEITNLYFDIQGGQLTESTHFFNLTLTNEAGQKTPVSVVAADNAISARYIFPVQGEYQIELIARNKTAPTEAPTNFRHSQRVARGVSSGTIEAQSYAWADFGLVGSLCGLVGLGITFRNRRAAIIRRSYEQTK